jgi:hypothetical protein
MATQTTTKLVDDLDGTVAERTVVFGWDGTTFEIDLNKKNIAALDTALAPYVEAGRRVRAGGSRRRIGGRGAGAAASAAPGIRDWARANGHAVSERGRIPETIVAAYEAAH